MRLELAALLAAGLLLAACSKEAPPAPRVDRVTSNDGSWNLEIEPPVHDCLMNEPCSFKVRLERSDGAPLPRHVLEVDAAMPDHRHGLNARPSVTRAADGWLQVDGLLLHMPGYWEVYFDITTGAVTERAQVAVER